MPVVKKTIGSVYFSYSEEYPTENDALEKTNGKFLGVELNKLRLERVKITKEKENDGGSNCQNETPEVARS